MKHFFNEITVLIKRNPAETIISILLTVLFSLAHEGVISIPEENIPLSPLVIAAAFLLNRLTSNTPAKFLYFISPALVAIPLFADATKWIDTTAFPISLFIAFITLFTYNHIKDNTLFVKNVAKIAKEILLTSVLIFAAHGLILAIFFSLEYLFDIFHSAKSGFLFYSAITIYLIAAPALFLYAHDNITIKEDKNGKRLLESLFNYVVTPAIIIYTLILYVYIIRIIITLSLPKGQLAYMVLSFTIVAILSKAIQLLLKNRPFDKFYNNLSYFGIIPLVLFWIGVIYRIDEYGFTEGRVYLIVSGIILTTSLLIFTNKKTGRYLYMCYGVIVLFAISTYIPPISAKNIAIKSQIFRVEKYGKELGLISDSGKLTIPQKAFGDSLMIKKYKSLTSSYSYLERACGGEFLKSRFGMESAYQVDSTIGSIAIPVVRSSFHLFCDNEKFTTDGYSGLIIPRSYKCMDDTLYIMDKDSTLIMSINLTDMLAQQLINAGYYTPEPPVMQGMSQAMATSADIARVKDGVDISEFFEANRDLFTTYTKDSLQINFRRINYQIYSDNQIRIEKLIITAILTK